MAEIYTPEKVKHPNAQLPACEDCILFEICARETGTQTTKRNGMYARRRGTDTCTDNFNDEGILIQNPTIKEDLAPIVPYRKPKGITGERLRLQQRQRIHR